MKKLKKLLVILLCVAMCVIPKAEAKAAGNIAYGADVGWLSQLEKMGYTWQDTDGTTRDVLDILKNHGVDSIRLRVFVNPPSSFEWQKTSSEKCLLGYCDTTGLIYMAKRAKSKGFKIMVDFHYSDHFADPAYQDVPEAWKDAADINAMCKYVYDYTYSVMKQLADNGVYPEWVQVGNEINSGILLPYGSTNNFEHLTWLLNSGYNAVKAVSSSSKVVTHLANGHKNDTFRWFFDNFITKYGGKTDIIGMSYYPYWIGGSYTSSINSLKTNLNDMASRYGKEVMVVEVGGYETQSSETYNTIRAVIDAVNAVPNGKGVGVFYWEPEGNSKALPDGYPLGTTTSVGSKVLKFTSAITAFEAAPGSSSSSNGSSNSGNSDAIVSGGYYKIINVGSGLALNVQGGSKASAAQIEQYSYGGWSSQQWSFESVGNGYYKISNKNSGLALDINGRSKSDGASCIQYAYNSGTNQQFKLTQTSDGYYQIVNRNSGKVLEISNNSTSNAAWCVQATNDGGSNQKWIIQKVN